MNEDSFFSINRLVEFGIGVNIASQMVKMMNESIQQMSVPGADNDVKRQYTIYYAVLDGCIGGPFSPSELAKMVSVNKITASTYIWKPGMVSWKLASEIPEVLSVVAPPELSKL